MKFNTFYNNSYAVSLRGLLKLHASFMYSRDYKEPPIRTNIHLLEKFIAETNSKFNRDPSNGFRGDTFRQQI
jgi:hypothetical protein